MDSIYMDQSPGERPRTVGVLVLLAFFAVVLSWLGVYGLTNALITADLLPPWPGGYDPRPKWMLGGFVGLLTLFSLMMGIVRWLSGRQLRRIDQMADGDEYSQF
jgi:hypothetical protein